MLRVAAHVETQLTVHTKFRLFQTTYKGERLIELERYNLPSDSWFTASVRQWAKNSEFSQVSNRLVDAFELVLTLLKDEKEWTHLITLQIHAVNRNEILAMYSKLESLLDQKEKNKKKSGRAFESFRTIFRGFLGQHRPGLASSIKRYYRPILKNQSTPRPLISHMNLRDSNGVARHPIDAIPHKSLKELSEKQREIINNDIQIIRDACECELSKFFIANQTLSKFFSDRIDNELINKLRRSALAGTLKSHPKGSRSASQEDLLNLGAAYWHLYNSGEFGKGIKKISTPHTERIEGAIQNAGVELPKRQIGIFRYGLFGDANTRIAALYALQFFSGWNASSIINLTTGMVIGESAPYQIQAIKSRTQKDTPVVFIEKADKLECYALEYLMSRLNNMKRLSIVGQNEERLWLSNILLGRNDKRAKTLVGFISDSRQFQLTHGLPLFSLEQIRVQVLAQRHSSNLSIEDSRLVAGHASIDTTARYLDQELIKARSSAINLEYQRQLEASVEYESNTKPTHLYKARSLLYPIGDGASCINPHSPPKDLLVKDGICTGQSCHLGNGCPNRRLLINPARIIENFKQVRFYKEHWQQIADQYPEKFRTLHLPAILFALALDEIIKKGPLSAIRLQIISALEKSADEDFL